MRIHKMNSSIATAIVGLTLITFGFQNCTKARFTIDEAAKEKALGEGSVFDQQGDDGHIIGGTANPGDDGSTPQFPGMGNDSAMPKFPGMGNDTSVPKFPGMGNDTSTPSPTPNSNGNDPSVTADMSTITVVPSPVCGPKASISSTKQATLPAASKVVAVLYQIENVTSPSANKVIQSWSAEPDITNMRTQLAASKPLNFKLNSKLAAGTYAVVLYDASRVSAPYSYKLYSAANAIAPVGDSVISYLDASSTFKVDSTGKQKAPQVANLLVGVEGDAACDDAGSIDPLLVQLHTETPQPIALTSPSKGVMFDLLGKKLNHKKVQTAWFASSQTENYFVVLPNKQGLVLGIDELFGDATVGPDGKYAKQGFAALAKHDDSGDKIISEDDEVFSQLRLWKDDNLDGVAQDSELHTLESKGVMAIDLRFDKRYQEMDKHGNITKYKSIVVMKDGQYGLVYDLYLRFLNK